MPSRDVKAEGALRVLQQVIRQPSPADPGRRLMIRRVPGPLRTPEFQGFSLFEYQLPAWHRALKVLSADLWFEHLKERDAEDALWRFVCAAHLGHRNLVRDFVDEHAREPISRTCYFPVEFLTVPKETELFGLKLHPAGAIDVPLPIVDWDTRMNSAAVLAVKCCGTRRNRMIERARGPAEHALRLLRATLTQGREIHPRLLQFRLGPAVWLDDGSGTYRMPAGETPSLELRDELAGLASAQEISRLPYAAANDIEQHANIAVGWYERALLETDAVPRMLYLFFALEAILGARSEPEKGEGLAVRRAVLGLATSDHISAPERIYTLYGEVRSEAVHGGQPEHIDDNAVRRFLVDVCNAINEYLRYARAEGITKRGRLLKALAEHERRKELEDWLYRRDPNLWSSLKPDP
jgi:hypothetical protein